MWISSLGVGSSTAVKQRDTLARARHLTQVKEKPVMANKKHPTVGYGKPPKHSQFKKGVSGNKNGRPKGNKNLATLLHKEMSQRVTISENGQRRTITKIEAAIKQLINKAATGDAKAIQAMINISKEIGDLKLPDPMQKRKIMKIELKIFDKDPETGQLRPVNRPNALDESTGDE
jgi:hypothetical protein